jgi:hypothetical protein
MRVPLDELEPEMVLLADIVDGAGRLLLSRGTVLTPKHLRYCQMWGIPEAEIEGSEVIDHPAAIDPVRLAAAEAKIRPRFTHVDLTHPVINALFHHCAEVVSRTPGSRDAAAS